MQIIIEVSLNFQRSQSFSKILLIFICITSVGLLYLRVNAGFWNVDQQTLTFWNLRGWSDKYLASKRKTKILEKWWIISQHNLLLARYTWPSHAPTLTRRKNTFSRGQQSRPLSRQRPPHLTQISVQRVTFSSLETKISHTGPNLENMVVVDVDHTL